MNKEEHKKLTFDDLLKRKLQRDKDKVKIVPIYIPAMGGELLFNTIPEYRLLNIIDDDKEEGAIASYEKSKRLIYASCKDLQNPELHKMLGVGDPMDAISALFTIDEVNSIGTSLLKINGIGNEENKVVVNIKN